MHGLAAQQNREMLMLLARSKGRGGDGIDVATAPQDTGNRMNRKLAPFLENMAESTTACLVTMVQGNLLALSFTHWMIASRTGILAGAVASAAILVARTRRRWVVSAVLGVATSVADYLVHPGQFGPAVMEAVVTGVGAALLSYMVGAAVRRVRATKRAMG